jgi:hypothetical protein
MNQKNKFTIRGLLLTFLAIFLVIFSIIKVIQYCDYLEIKKIKRNQVLANVKIIAGGSMKGSYVIGEYYYKGFRYEKRRSSHSNDIRIGENFKIIIDSTTPSRCDILLTTPFFYDYQKTDSTIGEVVSVVNNKLVETNLIRFSYKVGGKNFERFQGTNSTLGINVGDKYQVKYLIDTPTIAIISIER